MDREKLKELAVDIAQGGASDAERSEFEALLKRADADAQQEVAHLFDVAALLSIDQAKTPPASLKEKTLARIRKNPTAAPGDLAGLSFVFSGDSSGWIPLPVKGASMKVLSIDKERGYATVLGKLEAGSRYPAHSHIGDEQVYVVSGDLVIGETKMKAGDFHNAAAGSRHGVNYSEGGCVIVAVLTVADLEAQMAAMR